MTTSGESGTAGPLFEGGALPFDQLDPKKFEEFAFATLLCIQDHIKVRITGQPSGTGDGGFDVQGEGIPSGRVVCIQCKRQQASLGLPLAAVELGKVAATSTLEGSDVGEHRFICTGGVTRDLRRLLRSSCRDELVKATVSALVNGSDPVLVNQRARVLEESKDPAVVAESYVRGLQRIEAWDLSEFDSALSVRWDDVMQVVGRFFHVATVVREHPRANFDRSWYASQYSGFSTAVEPRLGEGELPFGVQTFTAQTPGLAPVAAKQRPASLQTLLELEAGESALVVADGGVGKTTLLELLRARLLADEGDAVLPVLVRCSDYAPGHLDTLIHNQLGVSYGTWRTLPDRIVLLCDGLNEAAQSRARALLSELEPLLQQRRLSCVFTSRTDGRSARLVLPQALVCCARLEPLTPMGVQRLARNALVDESRTVAFAEAYLRTAEAASSAAMWTPFAVRVALDVWSESERLPGSLGELLDALLRARASRNMEIQDGVPEHVVSLSEDVVLELARLVAFELMIREGRLSCSPAEAAKVLLAARKGCADALGAAALSSGDIEAVLRRHDLLHRSPDGHICLPHQLVAGALAAPRLASEWKQHLASLDNSVADDAWAMATRFVDPSEAEDYLKALFDADLMLGARAALAGGYHDHAWTLLESVLISRAPEVLRVHALFALARLGSEQGIAVLRRLAKHPPDTPLAFPAARALATSGDREFLSSLAARADQLSSGPGVMSGGDISLWETASLPLRLQFARQRLRSAAPGEPLNESLSLVAIERDPEDLPAVEACLHAAKDLKAWWTALDVVKEISVVRAQQLYEEALARASSARHRVIIMDVANKLGLHVDVVAAFHDVRLEPTEPGVRGQGLISARDLESELLAKGPLPIELLRLVEKDLPGASGEDKGFLWGAARGTASEVLARQAIESIKERGADAGYACNYLIQNDRLREEQRVELVPLCEDFLADREYWFSSGAWRALALMGKLGFTSRGAEFLSQMIRRLSEIRRQCDEGAIPTLSAAETRELRGFKPEAGSSALSSTALQLVSAVAEARKLLSRDDILALLWFEIANSNVANDMRVALTDVPADRVDEVLAELQDPRVVKSALEILATFPLTPLRLDLLRREFLDGFMHPAALSRVQAALKGCWNADVLAMVVDAVASIPDWPRSSEQSFWEFIHMVAARVGPDDLALLRSAMSTSRTSFARRVLGIWCQTALGSRVGLSRLAASNRDSSQSPADGEESSDQ